MEKYRYNIENTITSKQNSVFRFTFLGFHLLQIVIFKFSGRKHLENIFLVDCTIK